MDEIPHNLPIPLTSFIGREHEIAYVKRLLSTARMVTVTGAGGCGKTRLAIQVAGGLISTYKDGVWWVELAALSDETLVPQAIAQTLGVREVPAQALNETLASHLRAKELLLVIDNCEHLVTACAQLAEQLLQACPNLEIFAASREPFGIGGEAVYPLSPLSLPEPNDFAPARLLLSEAVRLFVERARAVKPDLDLKEDNARAMAQICQRLDGIPLALELAAARVKVLTVEHIAARLDDRFSLLTNGHRIALPRHQTMRATIDWSYDLLPDDARVLFRRLAVFAGGFTLKAAEQICSDQLLAPRTVLDLLTRLVDRSLAIVDQQDADERYRMLETIREYAREKLSEFGELAQVQNRHLDFFRKLAEEAEAQLVGADQILWLNRLESELDNLRAALSWGFEQVQESGTTGAKAGVQLAGALPWFWIKHGHWSEGRNWFQQALVSKDVPHAAEAKVLLGAGRVAVFQSDYTQAGTLFEQSLNLYREQDDKQGIADSLFWLGWVAEDMGAITRAIALTEESLNLQRQVGNRHGISFALNGLGELAYVQGDYSRATSFLEESLILTRELGDKWLMAGVLKWLSFVALRQGNYERAKDLASESVAINRELEDKRQIGSSLYALALASHGTGDNVLARTLLAEALSLLREVNEKSYTARCLEAVAGIAVAEGEYDRAARVFGAAEALRQAIHLTELLQRTDLVRNIAALRAQLEEATFAKAWAEGRALTLEQAIQYALETPAPRAEVARLRTARQAVKQEFGGLTEREREVAALIAQGESNREIAAELVVGERTVETHVTNILNKFGFSTRAQIRKWATEKGLVKRDK